MPKPAEEQGGEVNQAIPKIRLAFLPEAFFFVLCVCVKAHSHGLHSLLDEWRLETDGLVMRNFASLSNLHILPLEK